MKRMLENLKSQEAAATYTTYLIILFSPRGANKVMARCLYPAWSLALLLFTTAHIHVRETVLVPCSKATEAYLFRRGIILFFTKKSILQLICSVNRKNSLPWVDF